MEREELIGKYLSFAKDLRIISGAKDRNELRKNLNDLEAKIATEDTQSTALFSLKKILIATSILLVIAIGSFLIFNPFSVNTQSVYADNFEPYKNVVTPIVRGEHENSEESTAFMSYKNKDYELAAEQFEKLYENTKRPYFLLYQANSLLALNNTEKAIPLLEKHIGFNDQLSERGKWYLSLAYLKENRKKDAIELLEDLVHTGNFKKATAEQLLLQLR